MEGDDLLADRQADAAASLCIFAFEELHLHIFQVFRGNALARVADAHAHRISPPLLRQEDEPVLARVGQGIAQQVVYHLPDALLIGMDEHALLRLKADDIAVLLRQASHALHDALQAVCQAEAGHLHGSVARLQA